MGGFMKKKLFVSLLAAIPVFIYPCSVFASSNTYSSDTFSFTYDDETYTYSESTSDSFEQCITISAINMPDDGGGHNTVLACFAFPNTEYATTGSLSPDDLLLSEKTFASSTCQGLFEIDPEITLTQDSYNNTDTFCEYTMSLSDGTECYTKVFKYDQTIYYAVCRLCPYTADLNDGFQQIYDSISLAKSGDSSGSTASDTQSNQNYWQGKYDDLQKEHGELITEHNQLKQDYDELQRKYDEITKQSDSSDTSAVSTDEATNSVGDSEEDNNSGFATIDGFRDYKWGTSLDELMKDESTDSMTEGEDYSYEDNNLIIFGQKVSSYSADTLYMFNSNQQLACGFYFLTEKHIDYINYYNDYCDLVKLYKNKYGLPKTQTAEWKNDLYKSDQSEWGTALAAGQVVFHTDWTDSNGNSIRIQADGDNAKIEVKIMYKSNDYTLDVDNSDGI